MKWRGKISKSSWRLPNGSTESPTKKNEVDCLRVWKSIKTPNSVNTEKYSPIEWFSHLAVPLHNHQIERAVGYDLWPYRVQFPEYCSIEKCSSKQARECGSFSIAATNAAEWRHQNLVKISLVPLKWITHSQFICALFPLWHFGGPYGNGLPWSARRNVYFPPKWNEGTVEDARF